MKKIITQNTMIAIIAVMFAASLIACASNQESKRLNTEGLLAASGFKMGLADTPEKLAQLKKLPQRKIVPQGQGDNLHYIYADAEYCKCAYVGSEAAYKQYQKFTLEKELTEEERREAERSRQRDMDWGDWRFDQSW
jgi:hypothetical protein